MDVFGGHPYKLDVQDQRGILVKMDALKRQNLELLNQIEFEKQKTMHLRATFDAKLGAVEYENEMLMPLSESETTRDTLARVGATFELSNSFEETSNDTVTEIFDYPSI